MNSREVIKIIKNDGWVLKKVKGSHQQFTHPTKKGKETIPHSKKDLKKKTVQSIFTQAGL